MSTPEPNSKTPIQPLSRRPALAVCMILILGGGLCHGYLEGRWTKLVTSGDAPDPLVNLPVSCGNWELLKERDLEDSAQRILQCDSSVVRDYVNPATGAQVTVFVAQGPRGPMAVHTPEVCYNSDGIQKMAERVSVKIKTGDGENSFWKVRFKKQTQGAPALEVWYGWSNGNRWQAAKHPRFWFTDSLYKIQVAGPPSKPADKQSPIKDFMESFVPSLQQVGIGGRRNELTASD